MAPTQTRTSIGFDPGTAGVTPPTDPARRGVFLADVVVELGFADQESVQQLMTTAGQHGKAVEQLLLDSGTLDESQLSLAIAERNGLDHVDLDSFAVDMAAAEMVGRSVALRYCAVPIAFASDGALIVAVQDPFDSLGISDIEVMTKSEVRRVIATPSGIGRVIERLPDEPPPPPEPELPEPQIPDAQLPEPEPELPEPEPELPEPEAQLPEPEAQLPGAQLPEASAVVDPGPQIEAPESAQTELPAAPQPQPVPNGQLGDLSAELRVLQEAARKADALAATVGRRIEDLEGAGERAQRLDEELAAARERIAWLEQRLASVLAAAEDVREATEKLGALHRVLEESDR